MATKKLDQIVFDITKAPPSTEEIDLKRRQAEAVLVGRVTWRLLLAIGCAITVLIGVWQFTRVHVGAWFTAVLVALVLVPAATSTFSRATPWVARVLAKLAAILNVVAGGLIVAWVAAGALIALGAHPAKVTADGFVAAFAGFAGAALLGSILWSAIDGWFSGDTEGAWKAAQDLMPLDPAARPHQCIDFHSWVEAHSVVRSYQHQVAAQGRMLVVGEYGAAKAWVEDVMRDHAERILQTQAQYAWEQLCRDVRARQKARGEGESVRQAALEKEA